MASGTSSERREPTGKVASPQRRKRTFATGCFSTRAPLPLRSFSQRSEEALPAYHRALAIKPKYARGWLNLGISHANLGNQRAAVRCYLHTLELNPSALHVWNYVRMALGSMDRYDLVQVRGRLRTWNSTAMSRAHMSSVLVTGGGAAGHDAPEGVLSSSG